MKKNPYLLILGFSIAWTLTQAGFRVVYNRHQNFVMQHALEPAKKAPPVEPVQKREDDLLVMYSASGEAKTVPARDESGQKVKLPHRFLALCIVDAADKEVLIQQAFGTNAGKRYWIEKRFLFRAPALDGPFDPVYPEPTSSSAEKDPASGSWRQVSRKVKL